MPRVGGAVCGEAHAGEHGFDSEGLDQRRGWVSGSLRGGIWFLGPASRVAAVSTGLFLGPASHSGGGRQQPRDSFWVLLSPDSGSWVSSWVSCDFTCWAPSVFI